QAPRLRSARTARLWTFSPPPDLLCALRTPPLSTRPISRCPLCSLAPLLSFVVFAESIDQSIGDQIVRDHHLRCTRAMEQRSAWAVRPGHGDLQLRVAGMRHQCDREFAVRILVGHHKRPGPLDPRVVERRIVHPGITLDYEITEIGGLGRQAVGSIDDDHLLSRIVQSAGYQAAKRTET